MPLSYEDWQLEESKRLCWEDRLLHMNSKVRYAGNVDLKLLCDSITDPKDHRMGELGYLFKETVSDSDAAVLDKALDALIAYLKAADARFARRYAQEICDAIVANCLTGPPETVKKAKVVFMLWVELEAVDAVLDAMEKAIKTQVAKAVLPAVDVMFQATSEFGSKIVQPNRLLKMLLEIYDHPDQDVRASSKRLTLELCRWIGRDPVKSTLFEKMSDTRMKELDAELANVPVAAKPTRKLRFEQVKEPELEVATDATRSGPFEESAAEKTKQLQKMSLSDSQEQNKRQKQHYGSEKGFQHYIKSFTPFWRGDDSIGRLFTDEKLAETLKQQQEWVKSHKCTRCGRYYDISCDCQQVRKLYMDGIRPGGMFNYGSERVWETAKSAVSGEGGKDYNPAPWFSPSYTYD